jgi:hypothetical protein
MKKVTVKIKKVRHFQSYICHVSTLYSSKVTALFPFLHTLSPSLDGIKLLIFHNRLSVSPIPIIALIRVSTALATL